jgi:hypothetical protein
LQTQGLYPKVHIDVEVSSGEDDVLKTEASTDKRKAPDGDDAEDREASSVELITPNSVRSDALEQTDSSIADWVASIVPSASEHGCKHSTTIVRRNQPLPSADQVMSQIELPPYRRSRSPLDLIVVEIIFDASLMPFDAYLGMLLQPMIVLGLKRRHANLH